MEQSYLATRRHMPADHTRQKTSVPARVIKLDMSVVRLVAYSLSCPGSHRVERKWRRKNLNQWEGGGRSERKKIALKGEEEKRTLEQNKFQLLLCITCSTLMGCLWNVSILQDYKVPDFRGQPSSKSLPSEPLISINVQGEHSSSKKFWICFPICQPGKVIYLHATLSSCWMWTTSTVTT